MTERPVLRLVEGVDSSAARRVTAWKCATCRAGGRESGPLVPVVLEADVSAGRLAPGESAFACLACMAAGIVTLV